MRKIIINIQGDEINIYKASRFHGWLMEQIGEEYARELHNENTRPFSQYLLKCETGWEWHINTLTDEADQKIADRIFDGSIKEIHLKEGKAVTIVGKQKEHETIDGLLKKTYFLDSPRTCSIRFITPTAFKRNEKYFFFPEVKLIFQNLINRFQACGFPMTIGSSELLEEIQNKVEIVDYDLRTKRFYLENTNVKGVQGRIFIKIYGPQMFVNLIHFLLQFGSYSGIGIKTALGMGAVEVGERR